MTARMTAIESIKYHFAMHFAAARFAENFATAQLRRLPGARMRMLVCPLLKRRAAHMIAVVGVVTSTVVSLYEVQRTRRENGR